MTLRFRNLLIDLDDTLAPEWDFVSGGYRAAADLLAMETGQSVSALFNRFVYEHMKYGRHGIMDRMVAACGLGSAFKDELVAAYRGQKPEMHFYPGAREAIEQMVSAGCRVAVVTDGAVDVQRLKASSLGLETLVPVIVYCMELHAPKPDPAGFRRAMDLIGATASDTLIVGDDPMHDVQAGASLGVPVCRVRTGRYAIVEVTDKAPMADLPAFSCVPEWLGVDKS